MKVCFVERNIEKPSGGGAELSARRLMEVGISRGNEVVGTSKYPPPRADAYVVGNISKLSQGFFSFLSTRPFVKWEHGFEFCKGDWPKGCGHCNGCSGDRATRFRRLFDLSRLVVFQSPGHMREAEKLFHINQKRKYFVLPPPIDHTLFRNTHKTRSGIMTACTLAPHKGVDNIYKYAKANPSRRFYLYGKRWKAYSFPPNVKYVGYVAYEKMPGTYNKHQSLLHLPVKYEPSGRSVLEAWLCGCDIIVNGKVGVATYPWFQTDPHLARQETVEGAKRLWEILEKM